MNEQILEIYLLSSHHLFLLPLIIFHVDFLHHLYMILHGIFRNFLLCWKQTKNENETVKSHKKQKIVDSIKLQVNMQMEDVTVQIENDIRAIAALEVLEMSFI